MSILLFSATVDVEEMLEEEVSDTCSA